MGQVVEKRILSVEVVRGGAPGEFEVEETDEAGRPELAVVYELTNPYRFPVPVPIQSGLSVLYQYGSRGESGRKPELHVVPSTVTDHSHGELVYLADDGATAAGTAAVQRYHLGTGVPNYRHALAVNRTLVPGASLTIEARAPIPDRVERLILVDAMAGPDRPYGLYPQLLDDEKKPEQSPPPIRLYEGALFEADPPRIHIRPPEPGRPSRRQRQKREDRLPRWLTPERYAQLQTVLGNAGRLQILAIAIAAGVLALSMLARYAIVGHRIGMFVEAGRVIAFGLLAAGLLGGIRAARWLFAGALAFSGLFALANVLSLLLRGALDPRLLLTELTLIPILYLVGSAVIALSPAVRAVARPDQDAENDST
jgi:hypothetical protein